MKRKFKWKLAAFSASLLVGWLVRSVEAKTFIIDESITNNIIPKPVSYKAGVDKFTLNNDTKIYVKGNNDAETNELLRIANMLKSKVSVPTGFNINVFKGSSTGANAINLETLTGVNADNNEEYNLVSNNQNIRITAYTTEGIYRGIQTLMQMMPSDITKNSLVKDVEWIIPSAEINDKPQYSYRGFMIDVVRHFFSIDEIKRQIDHASQYKINRLHLHLSDDQGWRLEIKKYPDLTLIGGSSQVGGGKGGYYTQEQFKEIVQYAKDRYMEIIPEFDMPGHTNAALASLPFLNPDGKKKPIYTGTNVGFSTLMTNDEKTYEFIDDLFKEVSAISPSKYLHIGGDEALNTAKNDYDYFVGRVSKIAQKYGKTPIGWDPIDTSPEIDSTTILQNWQDSNKAARDKKMKMIISIAGKAYLDMKYDKNTPYGLQWAGYIPIETAYKWDPTDYAPQNLVLGIESPLWTENVLNGEQMDYMIYPRLLGYAEIGWTPKEQRNWEEYVIRLRSHAARLSNQGINFYKDPSIFK